MKALFKGIVVVVGLFLVTSLSFAEVPHLINYQARLTDSSGTPLNGAYNISFRIYDAEVGGNLKWSESHSGVVASKGIVSIILGSITSLNLPFDQQYWLTMQIGGDPEMAPRQRITSVGYAIRAEKADNGVPQGAIIIWTGTQCPSGYTRVTALDNRFAMGGATYGTTGGNLTHTHTGTTGNGSHGDHSFWGNSTNPNDPEGSYNDHTHTFSTNSTDLLPPYVTVLFCQKD